MKVESSKKRRKSARCAQSSLFPFEREQRKKLVEPWTGHKDTHIYTMYRAIERHKSYFYGLEYFEIVYIIQKP